jgi:ADP-glucose pyrophosphorylase
MIDYGLMKIDKDGRVLYFKEKPKGAELQAMQVDTTVLGLSAEEAVMKPYIASMGIYVFKKDVLLKLLRYPTSHVSFLLQILHLCVPHIVYCSCCLLDLGNVIVMEDMNSLWKSKTMVPVVPAMHMVL